MKTRKIFLPVLLALAITIVYGKSQTYNSLTGPGELFKVLATQGNISIQEKGSWKVISIGELLYETATLKVSENGYVGLIHKSGKTIEVKKPGTYNVKELASGLTSSKGGLLNKYADYVFGEFAKSDDKNLSKDHQNYMAVTGAVERKVGSYSINVLSPNKSDVISNSSVTLRWLSSKGVNTYVVIVMNRYEEPVLTKETSATMLIIDMNKLNLKDEGVYFWSVYAKENPKIRSHDFAISQLAKDKILLVEEAFNALRSELTEETAINNIIMASFYEQNSLFLDAINSYEEAIKIAPDVNAYKMAYKNFLDRLGLGNYFRYDIKK